MRSRFFGASSYDDEDDYDNEEEPMDMSGFIGSTTVEQPPIVVERKRASRETPPAPSTPFNLRFGHPGTRRPPDFSAFFMASKDVFFTTSFTLSSLTEIFKNLAISRTAFEGSFNMISYRSKRQFDGIAVAAS